MSVCTLTNETDFVIQLLVMENALKPAPDPRHKMILTAAFDVFRQYGFRRTSMEDIAQAAGMSRAALYLHFSSKEDIFRSLGLHYYDTTAKAVSAVLAAGHPPVQALAAAFEAQGGEIAQALLSSPHGAEFMDVKTANSADITVAGEARLVAIYADWLTAEAAAGRVSLQDFGGDAGAVAATILAALHGMKAGAADYPTYAASVSRLAAMFGRALVG